MSAELTLAPPESPQTTTASQAAPRRQRSLSVQSPGEPGAGDLHLVPIIELSGASSRRGRSARSRSLSRSRPGAPGAERTSRHVAPRGGAVAGGAGRGGPARGAPRAPPSGTANGAGRAGPRPGRQYLLSGGRRRRVSEAALPGLGGLGAAGDGAAVSKRGGEGREPRTSTLPAAAVAAPRLCPRASGSSVLRRGRGGRRLGRACAAGCGERRRVNGSPFQLHLHLAATGAVRHGRPAHQR